MEKLFKQYYLLIILFFVAASCSDDSAEPSITTSPETEIIFNEGLNFSSEVENKTIAFTTTKDWKITVAETRNSQKWYSVYPLSGKAGEANITIDVEENDTYDDRSVAITIDAGGAKKTVMISQKQKNAILITSNRFEVEQDGETISIEVKTNVAYKITVPQIYQNWIKQEEVNDTRALNNQIIKFKISPNERFEKREGEIIITDGTDTAAIAEIVKIYQSGSGVILLSKNKRYVSDKGGSISVELKSSYDYDMEFSERGWIEENKTRSSSSHTVFFDIKENEDEKSRNTKIIFFDKVDNTIADTLYVTQAGKDAIVLTEKEIELKDTDESFTSVLNTDMDFTIAIPDTCKWLNQITVEGNEPNEFYFNPGVNEKFTIRRGVILVKDKTSNTTDTIKIKQYGKPTYVSIDTDTIRATMSGGSYTVAINTNVPVRFDRWAVDPEYDHPDFSVIEDSYFKSFFEYANAGDIKLSKNINGNILSINVSPSTYDVAHPLTITLYGKYQNERAHLVIIHVP